MRQYTPVYACSVLLPTTPPGNTTRGGQRAAVSALAIWPRDGCVHGAKRCSTTRGLRWNWWNSRRLRPESPTRKPNSALEHFRTATTTHRDMKGRRKLQCKICHENGLKWRICYNKAVFMGQNDSLGHDVAKLMAA
jgi:hypothetical protein